MNINGVITKEELDYLADIFKKASKGSKVINTVGNIFFSCYILLVACLLMYGLIYCQGLIIMVCTCFVPVVIYSKFYNRKHSKLWKKYGRFNTVYNTADDKAEYAFASDLESSCTNGNTVLNLCDAVMCIVLNGYTVLTDSNGIHFVLKTDCEQQWQIFQSMKNHSIPVSMTGEGKGKPFANKLILDDVKNSGNRKKARKKRMVMLASFVVTVALYFVMLFIASQNNHVKNDNSVYYYVDDGKLFPMQQMTEKYNDTKSYKAMYDIYFDWISQTQKRAIAITTYNGKITQIEVICKDENDVNHRMLYQDASDKQMVVVCDDVIDDWHSNIMNLSNFKALSSSHPYVLKTADLGFVLYSYLELKDNHISTFVNDTMHVTFTTGAYHCAGDGYSYIVYMNDKEIHSSDEIYDYFNNMFDEILSVPYDELSFTAEDIAKKLEPYYVTQ